MREVHGVVNIDNVAIAVTDGKTIIHLSVGQRAEKLTPEEALFIAAQLTKAVKRIRNREMNNLEK